MQYVVKRDGREVVFNKYKISNAIRKASKEVSKELDHNEIINITENVYKSILKTEKSSITVEEIQNLIEKTLMDEGYNEIQRAYSIYRMDRTRVRDTKSDLMKAINRIGVETDRDNANVGNNFSSKLLRIASETNKWHNLSKMPKQLAKLHEQGDLYFHDLDSYNLTTNCLHIDTGSVFENGFNTGYGTIRKPKRIESAAE